MGSAADPDPGSGAFLTPGSKIKIRIRDPDPAEHSVPYFRELRNNFFV
jgi:hypothetical protein